MAILCGLCMVNTIFADAKVDISPIVAITDDDDPEFKELLAFAQEGDVECQYLAGRCYYESEFVERNYTEAFKWFLKASSQGHVESTYYVARCFLFGQGTEKNFEHGIGFLKNAASNGCKEAQEALDIMADEILKQEREKPTQSSSSASSSAPTTSQAQSSAKRNNSGIMTLKDHVFGFIGTPPSQCTISSVSNEVYRKHGFKLQETSGSLLSWYEISKPVGFDFVLNGKKIGWATFFQNGNYKSWTYGISELKTSTTFNDYANYTKQLQRELEAEGYVFNVLSSADEEYDVESRNKDVVIELRCCSGSRLRSHDAWTISISFISE